MGALRSRVVKAGRRSGGALALVLMMAAAGCATGGAGGAEGAGGGSRDVLSAAEMEAWGGEDLLTVIRRVRPVWLQARKAVTMQGAQPISVVVDGAPQPGGVDQLRAYRVSDVEEARFVNARDATTRYGLSMMSGAIVVKLKR